MASFRTKGSLVEYQYQAAMMFAEMLSNVRKDFFTYFLNIRLVQRDTQRKGGIVDTGRNHTSTRQYCIGIQEIVEK